MLSGAEADGGGDGADEGDGVGGGVGPTIDGGGSPELDSPAVGGADNIPSRVRLAGGGGEKTKRWRWESRAATCQEVECAGQAQGLRHLLLLSQVESRGNSFSNNCELILN